MNPENRSEELSRLNGGGRKANTMVCGWTGHHHGQLRLNPAGIRLGVRRTCRFICPKTVGEEHPLTVFHSPLIESCPRFVKSSTLLSWAGLFAEGSSTNTLFHCERSLGGRTTVGTECHVSQSPACNWHVWNQSEAERTWYNRRWSYRRKIHLKSVCLPC